MKKVVLITGSAGGVGRAAVQRFIERGWFVVATARSPDSLSALGKHSHLSIERLDVMDKTSIQSCVSSVIQRHGQIDVLVNNAGIGVAGPLEGTSDVAMRRAFETNFFGPAVLTSEVVPHMRDRMTGTIVNVTSVAGRVGIPFHSIYSASKFALEGLTEALAFELEPFGIRLRLVEPGGIRTDFQAEWFEPEVYQPDVSQLRAQMERGIKRAPLPTGVADAIYLAATDARKRLRYPANSAGPLLIFRWLLSDAAMRGMLAKMFLKARPS